MQGVFLLRAEIESFFTRLAAGGISDDKLAEIVEINEQMKRDVAAGDLSKMLAYNSQFHSAIAAATGYHTLREIEELVHLRMIHHQVTLRPTMTTENWASVTQEHDAIINALKNRDADTAAQLARQHVLDQFPK